MPIWRGSNICPADTHKGQFTGACLRCHVMDGWKPASKHDHNTAKFHLTGLHQKVECGKCHKKDAVNVTHFTGLQFASCSSCHRDPHEGRFKKTCESCHTTNGWKQVASGHFDHATTRFPLRGRHAATAVSWGARIVNLAGSGINIGGQYNDLTGVYTNGKDLTFDSDDWITRGLSLMLRYDRYAYTVVAQESHDVATTGSVTLSKLPA